ncbi:ATP-dependent RNA helicase ded1 [Mycoemilia scoparia]|uniref:RNA helicase n=1 Tax=Mycoemilia scoparia TaxID=417184 RepID=A0A9W8A3C7_9FUNG|nr:ATP-dependent RNA helicase ded1 [Mycoemilia scoparia]
MANRAQNVPGKLNEQMAGMAIKVNNSNSGAQGKPSGGPTGKARYIPPHLRGKPPTAPIDKDSALERTTSWAGDGTQRDEGRRTRRFNNELHSDNSVDHRGSGAFDMRSRRADRDDFGQGRHGDVGRTSTFSGRRDDSRGFGRGYREPLYGMWESGKHIYGRANPRVECELFGDPENSDRNTAGINFEKYEDIPVDATGKDVPEPITSFDDAKLDPLLFENIGKAGYTVPTPVQKYSISIGSFNRDLMACAQTGSGKTGGFLFPILNQSFKVGPPDVSQTRSNEMGYRTRKATPIALILSPTRELTSQIYEEARKFCYRSWVRPCVVYGGADIGQQIRQMNHGCDLLVATPGRLVDLLERGRITLEHIRYLVLDEADRMLDMGFEPQIRRIVESENMPGVGARQTLMFSATFPRDIQMLARDFLDNYIFLSVGRVGSTSENITQRIEYVENHDKQSVLLDILSSEKDKGLTLIFVETKRMADMLNDFLLDNEFPATSIHGDRTQRERERALDMFRTGRAPIMVATAVAARGLDIPNVTHVINYDLPSDIDDYVHRIGRTGRAGNTGIATGFFNRGNRNIVRDLVEILKEANQDIPDWLYIVQSESSGYGSRGGRGGRGGRDHWGGGGGHRGFKAGHRNDVDHRFSSTGSSRPSVGGGNSSSFGGGRGGNAGSRHNSNNFNSNFPPITPALQNESKDSWF